MGEGREEDAGEEKTGDDRRRAKQTEWNENDEPIPLNLIFCMKPKSNQERKKGRKQARKLKKEREGRKGKSKGQKFGKLEERRTVNEHILYIVVVDLCTVRLVTRVVTMQQTSM